MGSPFAANVAEARRNAGWTQCQLAARLGMTQSAVCGWEQGNRFPTVHTLYRIAHVLGVTASDLVHVCGTCRDKGMAGFTCNECGVSR